MRQGREEDAVDKGGVEGHQEADWRHQEFKRPDEVFMRDLPNADVPFSCLAWSAQLPLSWRKRRAFTTRREAG